MSVQSLASTGTLSRGKETTRPSSLSLRTPSRTPLHYTFPTIPFLGSFAPMLRTQQSVQSSSKSSLTILGLSFISLSPLFPTSSVVQLSTGTPSSKRPLNCILPSQNSHIIYVEKISFWRLITATYYGLKAVTYQSLYDGESSSRASPLLSNTCQKDRCPAQPLPHASVTQTLMHHTRSLMHH